MATRRRSAPASHGKNWTGTVVAMGTLLGGLGGLAALLGVVLPQLGPGASSSPSSFATSSSPPPATRDAGGPADPLLVRSADAAAGAVVRIEATGFAEPAHYGPEGVGHGSGFVIDPSGIVVTNSHVVDGAKTVTVWVGSELTKQAAEVIGVAECADLAVIRLRGRADLPYLDWSAESVKSDLQVHAAGFPIGGSKPKMTAGKVSGARGRTDEARLSVDDTIELDANIPVGSAGGPVVTNDGKVMAVTYPSDDPASRPFAITWGAARPILQVLQAGRDVTAIGLNGYAQKSNPAGIWVVAVKPGSPAAAAGILPGDVVTQLDGRSMAATGTMAEYCDVVSEYQAGDPMAFTVFREEARATLTGVLDGDPVKPEFAFAVNVGGASPGQRHTWTSRATKVRGSLKVDAPSTWKEARDHAWKFDGAFVGPGMLIAPNVKSFLEGFKTPGALVTASAILGRARTPDEVLDSKRDGLVKQKCKLDGRATFTRGGYAGVYDLWNACAGGTSQFLTIAASKDDHIIYIQFQASEPDDLAVLDRMLVTLEFTPDGS